MGYNDRTLERTSEMTRQSEYEQGVKSLIGLLSVTDRASEVIKCSDDHNENVIFHDRAGKIAREVLLANIGIKASWNSRDGERVDAGFCDSVAVALRAEYQRGQRDMQKAAGGVLENWWFLASGDDHSDSCATKIAYGCTCVLSEPVGLVTALPITGEEE